MLTEGSISRRLASVDPRHGMESFQFASIVTQAVEEGLAEEKAPQVLRTQITIKPTTCEGPQAPVMPAREGFATAMSVPQFGRDASGAHENPTCR